MGGGTVMTVIKKFNTGTSQWEAIVVGKQGPPGLDGTGAPVFGQVAKMTSDGITIATQGVYQSTGLTAVLDGENAGISLGTSDLFAIKNTSGVTRRLKIAASYDASMAGPAKVLGLALAVNGTVDLDTECRATTGLQGAIAKLATQWIIDLADGDEVALYVANHSSTVDIDFQRGRIVATSVAGFGPQGPTGATGPAGPGVATGGTTGDLLVKQSSTDFDTAWQAFGLDDLSDVDTSGISDGNALIWDQSLGLFVPTDDPLVPSGGTTGQVLVKASGTDYDTAWAARARVETFGITPIAGEYVPPLPMSTTTTILPFANFLLINYRPIPVPMTIDRIGVRVTTLEVGATLRLGFFTLDDSRVFTLVQEAGTVDCSTIGFKAIDLATPLTVTDGGIFIGRLAENSSNVMRFLGHTGFPSHPITLSSDNATTGNGGVTASLGLTGQTGAFNATYSANSMGLFLALPLTYALRVGSLL
jgi:hypothetical protein